MEREFWFVAIVAINLISKEGEPLICVNGFSVGHRGVAMNAIMRLNDVVVVV